MRHRTAGKKLGRDSSHRRAVLRNLVTSLFRFEEISTTEAKAKALRPIAEKMITLAKRGDLHARRQALAYLLDKSVAHKLFEQMKDRFSDRQGGYIRILKAGYRVGDNAPLAIVQLLLAGETKKGPSKAARKDKKGARKVTKEGVEKKETPKEEMEGAEPEEAKKSAKGKSRDAKQKRDTGTGEKKVSKEKKGTSRGKRRGTGDEQESAEEQVNGSESGQEKVE